LAKARNASVILMDDGFQNPAIAKDASLIVIDAERGVGNGKVFPAGPLRAPLLPQIARTDALIVIGNGSAAASLASAVAARGGPVLTAQIKTHEASLAALRGKRVLAFAGIGDPGRFFRTLRGCGIEVATERTFSDHHPFSNDDIAGLIAEAKRGALTLVTTEKDMARLRNVDAAKDIVSFTVTLELEESSRLRSFVMDRLFQARAKKFRGSR
jgi:tetraacyldisaccharide 4'-kinase